MKSIGRVATKLAPSMVTLYLLGGLVVILANFGDLPEVLSLVFREAFSFLVRPFRESLERDLVDLAPEKRLIEQIGHYQNMVREHERSIHGFLTWVVETPGLRDWVVRSLLDLHQRFAGVLSETLSELLPKDADDEACVLFSDIFPTAFECGVQLGQVKPGDTFAIVGAGPIGLATLMTAQLYSPSALIVLDPDPGRLEAARALGATHVVPAPETERAMTRRWISEVPSKIV